MQYKIHPHLLALCG